MEIAGIQKLTLVDFPGRVAATIFTRGCSFRCGFCHNPELVVKELYQGLLSEKQVFDFFEKRYGKLTGVCITGGEPLLQKDIGKFIAHLKALGFDIKLDTNGSFPDRLKEMIELGDLDYIAMDIKNSLPKYGRTVSIQNSKFKIQNEEMKNPEINEKWKMENDKLQSKIRKSIKLIMDSGIDYEFRTTVCHPLHEVKDFEEIGQMIKGAKRYYLQNFVKSKHVNEAAKYKPLSDKDIKEAVRIMKKFVGKVEVR